MPKYRFDITPPNIVRRSGFPAVPGRGDSKVIVDALDGTYIPEGDYQLYRDEDGAALKVQNVGLNEWVISA